MLAVTESEGNPILLEPTTGVKELLAYIARFVRAESRVRYVAGWGTSSHNVTVAEVIMLSLSHSPGRSGEVEAAIGRREGGSVDADIRKEALECEGGDLRLIDPICKLKQTRLLVFVPVGAFLCNGLPRLPFL